MNLRVCAALILAAAIIAPTAASAGCPDKYARIRGTTSSETLKDPTAGRGTCFWGNGGNDTFIIENPKVLSNGGEIVDVVMDYRKGDILNVPGTVASWFISAKCYVYWLRDGAQQYNFMRLDNCGVIPKADIRIK